MPGRTPLVTSALLVGTVATAAGLNMAVMGLATGDATPPDAATPAAAPIGEAVALTSAEVDPIDTPVLAVGLPAAATTPNSAAASSDPTAPPTAGPVPAAAESPPSTDSPSPVPSTGSTSAGQPDRSTTSPPAATAPTVTSPAPPGEPTTTAPAATPTTAPTAAVSTEYVTYAFEGVASIVVAVHDGDELEFWSVTTEDGWAFLVEDRGPDKVKIKFRPTAGGDEAEFELEFDDGRLKAKREY